MMIAAADNQGGTCSTPYRTTYNYALSWPLRQIRTLLA